MKPTRSISRSPKPRPYWLSRLALLSAMPLAFFGVLLFTRASIPYELMFDEIHYVPAAKALLLGTDNLNWVHPPLAKYLMGLGWWVFSDRLHLLGEPAVFRWVAVVFGLWSLWAVRAWMLALGFSAKTSIAAVWLTGFNFLWFVQSKTAMLDIFYVAFALWGVLDVWRFKSGARMWRGWVFLGLAFACKWSAAPYIVLALFMSASPLFVRLAGGAVAGLAYAVTFVPLAFLKNGPVPLTDFFKYHQRMLDGFDSIATAAHPYQSSFWEWPTMARPIWYLFDSSSAGERCIWAGGNPVLFWTVFPLLFVVVWFALRHGDRIARILAAMYWVPLLFWVLAPRKLQLFYYYLAPSFMLGPIVVWAHERLGAGGIFIRGGAGEIREARGWLLMGFVLLCAAAFVYFLPIMDGRLLTPGRFQDYMWFRSWI